MPILVKLDIVLTNFGGTFALHKINEVYSSLIVSGLVVVSHFAKWNYFEMVVHIR